jgi:hypothetical protein
MYGLLQAGILANQLLTGTAQLLPMLPYTRPVEAQMVPHHVLTGGG